MKDTLYDINEEELRIEKTAQKYLKETASWSTFLAIVGFFIAGLIILGSIVIAALGSSLLAMAGMASYGYGALFGLVFVVFAIVYIFPSLYLFRFADATKSGLASQSNSQMQKAFLNLKSFYKFVGIAILAIIIFYVVLIIGVIVVVIFKYAI